jgi:hypothetical protein
MSKSIGFKFTTVIFFIGVIIIISSCNGCDNVDQSTPIIETPETETPIEEIKAKNPILRFDLDLTTIGPSNLADTTNLVKKYPGFYPIYFDRLMRMKRNSAQFPKEIIAFLNDANVKDVFASCRKEFTDLSNEEAEIQKAFARYQYHFPDSSLPNLLTFVCGFQYNIITTDRDLCIGLEMYLGSDSKFYPLVQFPDYKIANMRREMMVPDAIKGFLLGNYELIAKDLLDQIIFYGKIMYAQAVLLPDLPEHVRFGYSKQQWDWCIKNEKNIWTHFVDQKLLYSTDFKDEVKYINDGPFTPGLATEAPGRIGIWLGYRIVSQFVKNKNITSLSDLFRIADQRIIFQQSKYKPLQ